MNDNILKQEMPFDDEVVGLKQITGIAESFKDQEFSKSWIAETKED